MQVELWHYDFTYDFLVNVVVIDISVYMSVADRNKCSFISLLLRAAILHLCSLKMPGKVGEKLRNLIREFESGHPVANGMSSTTAVRSRTSRSGYK